MINFKPYSEYANEEANELFNECKSDREKVALLITWFEARSRRLNDDSRIFSDAEDAFIEVTEVMDELSELGRTYAALCKDYRRLRTAYTKVFSRWHNTVKDLGMS